jgi:hypothetical protein
MGALIHWFSLQKVRANLHQKSDEHVNKNYESKKFYCKSVGYFVLTSCLFCKNGKKYLAASSHLNVTF